VQSDLAFLEFAGLSGELPADRQAPVQLAAAWGGERRTWAARIVRTEGVFDERNRVLRAIARIEDPYNVRGGHSAPLPVGLFVEASIRGRQVDAVVSLPRQCLRADGTLLVVMPDNTLSVRRPDVLRTDPETIHLRSGVADGEPVCLTAIEFATDGMPVRIVGQAAGEVTREQ
jgi:multidrug efflux pump subunit AcrA (membrane-fusion protein)